MFGVVCTEKTWGQIREVIQEHVGDSIVFSAVGNELDLLQELNKSSRIEINILIIDISVTDNEEGLIRAIRRFRIINDATRIIVIIPFRTPPDKTISEIVNMGIYDIVVLSENEEERRDTLIFDLLNAIQYPAKYKDAVRWLSTDDEEQNSVEEKKTEPAIIRQTVERKVIVEVISSSTIAAISAAPTGKSFLTWNLAYLFARRNYKTSYVNYDFGYSSNIRFGLDPDIPKALTDLNNKDVRNIYQEGYPVSDNLLVFTDTLLNKNEPDPVAFLDALNFIKIKSDIVIIDPPSGHHKNLKNILTSSSINLFIFDLDHMHTEINLAFLREIKDLLTPEKTVVILNNVFPGSEEIYHLRDIVKNLKIKFKDVVEVSNCGIAAYDAMFTDKCPYDIAKDKNFKSDMEHLMSVLNARSKQRGLFRKFLKK